MRCDQWTWLYQQSLDTAVLFSFLDIFVFLFHLIFVHSLDYMGEY